jgi:hypothetical protein
MSENQPEADDQELENVAGGTSHPLSDHQRLQDSLQRYNALNDDLSNINKKLAEMTESLVRIISR